MAQGPLRSGRGKIYVAQLDLTYTPGPLRYVGYSKEGVMIKFGIEEQKVKESDTGLDSIVSQMTTGYDPAFDFAMQEWTRKNLALALWSDSAVVAAGTVTDEEQATGLVADDVIKTVRPKISSVVITDDAGSPATLVAGTDYEVTDAQNGIITLLDVTGFTQPFHVAYAYAESYQVPFGTTPDREHRIVFAGLNKANQLNGFGFELYRVKFKPTEELIMKSFEFNDLKLTGTLLPDPSKPNDPLLGRHGKSWGSE